MLGISFSLISKTQSIAKFLTILPPKQFSHLSISLHLPYHYHHHLAPNWWPSFNPFTTQQTKQSFQNTVRWYNPLLKQHQCSWDKDLSPEHDLQGPTCYSFALLSSLLWTWALLMAQLTLWVSDRQWFKSSLLPVPHMFQVLSYLRTFAHAVSSTNYLFSKPMPLYPVN